jgi:hypothetical protein
VVLLFHKQKLSGPLSNTNQKELITMTVKCYLGLPIEFTAEYDGVLVKLDGGPDTNPVYGLKMKNISFLKPTKIHIGKGFYVEPELPHGITHYGSEASYDLELLVTGPGLPAAGQRVKFQWGLSPCYGYTGTINTKCKQFLNMEVVKSKSGASSFTIEFISGYTEQQFTQGSNKATWRICYDGPFEMVMMAPLPAKWDLARIPLWLDLITSKVEECGGSAPCEINLGTSQDVIDGAITELIDLEVPEDLIRPRYDIVVNLQQSKDELSEAEKLFQRAEETDSEKERLELRNAGLPHLEKVVELNRQVMELLLHLQEQLRRKPI